MKQDYMLHFTWTFFFPCPTELLPREDIIHDNLQYLGNVFGLGFLAGYRVARSKNISSSFIKVAQSIRHRCNIRESFLKIWCKVNIQYEIIVYFGCYFLPFKCIKFTLKYSRKYRPRTGIGRSPYLPVRLSPFA